MRRLAPLAPIVATGLLAACAQPQPYEMTERDASRLQEALAGKTAGAPKDCLPLTSARNPEIIDGGHILYKQGRTTWLNTPEMRCPLVGGSGYVLVLEPFGGSRICDGDIAKVLDTSTGAIVGACSLGKFVPYTETDEG